MEIQNCSSRPSAGLGGCILLSALLALSLGGCEKRSERPLPSIRPVRTVLVEERETADPAVVTGHIRAKNEVRLAFRLPGKIKERTVEVGDEIRAGQTVALLDDQIEQSVLRAAQAELRAANATLDEAEATERRQSSLLASEAISQYDYDLALRQLKTSRAQVEAAQARLEVAQEQLSYTVLISEAAGVVTQTEADTGEVVQAGQTILKIAEETGRDAVFDMPAWIIREGLEVNTELQVTLSDNETIGATGRVREISPQADPITRNYEVKVELIDSPTGMFLGATVTGAIKRDSAPLVEIPSTALTMVHEKPAVWVLNHSMDKVERREIVIDRYTPKAVLVRGGLQPGEHVVTAGVQELHEGQVVKSLGDPS